MATSLKRRYALMTGWSMKARSSSSRRSPKSLTRSVASLFELLGWDARADLLGIESAPSKLEIVTREVPSPEAMAQLREAVSTLMRDAIERSLRATEAEEPLVQGALAALRDG